MGEVEPAPCVVGDRHDRALAGSDEVQPHDGFAEFPGGTEMEVVSRPVSPFDAEPFGRVGDEATLFGDDEVFEVGAPLLPEADPPPAAVAADVELVGCATTGSVTRLARQE